MRILEHIYENMFMCTMCVYLFSNVKQNQSKNGAIFLILFNFYRSIQHADNIFNRSIKQLGSTFDAGPVIFARMILKTASYFGCVLNLSIIFVRRTTWFRYGLYFPLGPENSGIDLHDLS